MLTLFLAPAYDASASLPQKRVLLLYSEDKAHPAHELTDQGIRAIFQSNKLFKVRLFTEYLDVSRFSGLSHVRTMADYLRRKYAGMKVDAIITVYPAAMDFLLGEGIDLFPGTPIVANEVTREYAEKLKHSPPYRSLTGTIVGENAAGVFDTAFRIRPDSKRVALVGGTSPNDIYGLQIFRKALEPYLKKIELIDLTGLPMEATLTRVGSLPPDTIVLYEAIARDGEGRIFVPREALLTISRASNAPVFGLYDSFMGYGIVGGRLVSWEQLGGEAAAIALRIMGGESPASIPFGGEQAYITAFDWRELKRWKIPESVVPAGAEVRYRVPSLWEDHRGTILGGISFIIIEALLIVALFVNLHRRKRAEIEIAASALRYRTVADYTHDWEYWSAPDGTFSYVSPSCERVTGYSVREFIGDPSLFRKIIIPEDRETWEKHGHDARDRLKLLEIEFRIRTKGGETRWIGHVCQPVSDAQGNSLGIRASNRDISERKKAEFEAQQHRNELAHVNRIATMGELTSSLAHELNQPLAAIRNYANAAQRYLSQGKADLTKVREALEGILRDDRRAAEVISRVRGLLKKEEPRYRLVHMNDVIRGILAFIRSDSILEGLSIQTELAPGLPAVSGDQVQLQQVLLNLMLNAVDAMNNAKSNLRKLVIKTENEEDRGVKVSVRDFGSGIDEAHRDKLFEPFYTTKSAGMGMGLPISQRIIHAHGGEIQAENNPDGGATFYFTLPAMANRDPGMGRRGDTEK
jgi:PAS domain S-box-containing protein